MTDRESQLRAEMVQIGRLMYEKGMVAGTDGNISARLDQERMLATPTRTCKGLMTGADLIVCDMQGNKISGARDRTSEILMHATIYEMRPDVTAVVHAHPPVATGFAVAGRSLELPLLPEVVIYLGSVPLAAYGLPGTPELSDALRPLITKHDGMLMANHGAVTYGADLCQAFAYMEMIEHFARISLVAEILGGPRVLPEAEVSRLMESRSRYGVRRDLTASAEEDAPPSPS
jgi:L-fuculose-phosphate aldolase